MVEESFKEKLSGLTFTSAEESPAAEMAEQSDLGNEITLTSYSSNRLDI